MRKLGIVLLFVVGVVGACNGARPDGEIAEGDVLITAVATVDDVLVGSGGMTASSSIEVQGMMIDRYGVESSYYSWKGSDLLPLSLDPDGSFSLELSLAAGENELVLQGKSVASEEATILELVYTLDNEAPVIETPNDEFAATIKSESEMVIDKEPTAFTLSGGEPVAMRDGVSFSKYSSTWGDGGPNRPIWRFNLNDNLPLDDAVMEFRIYHITGGTEELFVDWTKGEVGENSDFEFMLGSDLDNRLASVSGDYILEARAFDSAGNSSEPTRVFWTQSILAPPIFIEPGSEDIMESTGGSLDPSSYIVGINFSELAEVTGLVVGSIRIGNPNNMPVLVRLDPSELDGRSSHRSERKIFAVDLDAPGLITDPCNGVIFPVDNISDCDPENPQFLNTDLSYTEQPDLVNRDINFLIKDVGGNVIESNDNIFVMPPNTIFHAIVSLPNNPQEILDTTHDVVTFGPLLSDITYYNYGTMLRCVLPIGFQGCDRWIEYLDHNELLQHYVSWDFTTRVDSKISLDFGDSTPWSEADPEEVIGYTRHVAVSNGNWPIPTSHEDVQP